jgi:hypothetical protein
VINRKPSTGSSGPTLKKPDPRMEAVQKLANLLNDAKPLVELLNSPRTAHRYRKALRDRVGVEEYFHLADSLHQMCSMAAWQLSHSKETPARLRPRTYRLP